MKESRGKEKGEAKPRGRRNEVRGMRCRLLDDLRIRYDKTRWNRIVYW